MKRATHYDSESHTKKITGEYIGTGKDVFIELPLGRWNVYIKPADDDSPDYMKPINGHCC